MINLGKRGITGFLFGGGWLRLFVNKRREEVIGLRPLSLGTVEPEPVARSGLFPVVLRLLVLLSLAVGSMGIAAQFTNDIFGWKLRSLSTLDGNLPPIKTLEKTASEDPQEAEITVAEQPEMSPDPTPVSLPPDPHTIERWFSDATGKYRVQATVAIVNQGEVALKRSDSGKVVTVKLNELSEADQWWIKTTFPQDSNDD